MEIKEGKQEKRRDEWNYVLAPLPEQLVFVAKVVELHQRSGAGGVDAEGGARLP
jgi:hypothetical protein